jgi:hypothetical protein
MSRVAARGLQLAAQRITFISAPLDVRQPPVQMEIKAGQVLQRPGHARPVLAFDRCVRKAISANSSTVKRGSGLECSDQLRRTIPAPRLMRSPKLIVAGFTTSARLSPHSPIASRAVLIGLTSLRAGRPKARSTRQRRTVDHVLIGEHRLTLPNRQSVRRLAVRASGVEGGLAHRVRR